MPENTQNNTSYTVLNGDTKSLSLEDESVDAVVCDPPYGLSFMGKGWDKDVPGPEYWEEVFRVLKPGGHLLAFGGTRTWHWLTVGIEEAGFTIRDCLSWNYGVGFPKSHNFGCDCDAEQDTEHGVRQVRGADLSPSEHAGEERGQVLLSGLPEQGLSARRESRPEPESRGGEQPGVEGRGDVQASEGDVQAGEARQVSAGSGADGEGERIHTGAPEGHGEMGRSSAGEHGGGSSQEPRQPRQSPGEPGAVAEQRGAQESGSRGLCPRCGKPRDFQGWGTALKPGWEPIVLAMKPLDGTFAENATEHGVAGLNIDGCRLSTSEDTARPDGKCKYGDEVEESNSLRPGFGAEEYESGGHADGRWPANTVLSHTRWCVPRGTKRVESDSDARAGGRRGDGQAAYGDYAGYDDPPEVGYADEDGTEEVEDWDCPPSCPVRMLDEQSGERRSAYPNRDDLASSYHGTHVDGEGPTYMSKMDAGRSFSDTGGASRFYYCAKASRSEREAGMPDVDGRANKHPTVKPVELMRWLVRLVSRPEHTVLDPFMGSGSTGIACALEGRSFIGVDKNKEYCEIAVKRIEHAQEFDNMPDDMKYTEAVKEREKQEDSHPDQLKMEL